MEKFKFDVVSQTLTITAKFNEQMANPMSEEYKLVMRFRKDFPNLTIAKKTHKSATSYTTKSGEKFNCNQFKNLKYENMERFMMGLPNGEVYMDEYLFLRNHASEVQTNGYALIRRWFVAQFPDFRKNPMFYLTHSPKLVSSSAFIEKETDNTELANVA